MLVQQIVPVCFLTQTGVWHFKPRLFQWEPNQRHRLAEVGQGSQIPASEWALGAGSGALKCQTPVWMKYELAQTTVLVVVVGFLGSLAVF